MEGRRVWVNVKSPLQPNVKDMEKVEVYDTTLRDGNQAFGVNFSVEDKIKLARRLDAVGVHYIEGGWPNKTNEAEMEFFRRARGLQLSASITAFGRTVKPGLEPDEDEDLLALAEAQPDVITVMGKAWRLHVQRILGTTLDENLRMVKRSVEYLRRMGFQVMFDAEHFFDGFKDDKRYALQVLSEAASAGAETLVLCDTRGGATYGEVSQIVKEVSSKLNAKIGIHAHNDRGLATANTLAAVSSGATQVQGTVNGVGERCGNADLVEVACNLEAGYGVSTGLKLSELTSLSEYVYEIANTPQNPYKPFVGRFAFAHKGGVHAHAVLKLPEAYEAYDPQMFGNKRMIAVSSQSGVSNIVAKAREFGFHLEKGGKAQTILRRVKGLEARGYHYENANASLYLLFARELGVEVKYFDVVNWRAYVLWQGNQISAESTVKLRVGGREVIMAGEGNGPVNAFDVALRNALKTVYPEISKVQLVGYRVREIDLEKGTAATVQVFIEFRANGMQWSTIGVSPNILEASEEALIDGYNYYLHASRSGHAFTT
ncbi:MAG: citramalate synthase [Candidatus Bathyarchaeia archaeon]